MSTFDPDLVPLLAAAAEDGSLHLHFQPEVDLASGSVVGMEALLRWRHPTRGLLRPAEFFDAAEAGGLVRVLGQWAFRAAVAECRAWAERAWPTGQARVRLWLNVAAAQFTAPGFLVAMERLVRGRALPAGALGLELTEQTLAIGQVGTHPAAARRAVGAGPGARGRRLRDVVRHARRAAARRGQAAPQVRAGHAR